MNILDSQSIIHNFINKMGLLNYENQPTRIDVKFYKKSNKIQTSKSIIDLFLHNKNSAIKCETIDNNFSDHKFVYVQLKILSSYKIDNNTISIRNLNQNNTQLICDKILDKNFIFCDSFNVNDDWCSIKNSILDIINNISPLKQLKIKLNQNELWFDAELKENQKAMFDATLNSKRME